jgi:mitochondrial cardiolipin hydrolase
MRWWPPNKEVSFGMITLSTNSFTHTTSGVKVRIVGEGTMAHSSGSELTRLDKEGLPIRIWGGDVNGFLMHHKFCLIDANWTNFKLKCPVKQKNYGKVKIPATGVLITGSSNWTMQALTGNCENVVITSNKTIVERHQSEFQRLWQECGLKFT